MVQSSVRGGIVPHTLEPRFSPRGGGRGGLRPSGRCGVGNEGCECAREVYRGVYTRPQLRRCACAASKQWPLVAPHSLEKCI